ncbi:STAGA complex 65 subunit gamma-like [Oncorhynchus nerka]|uniref:STAGA complex 65 subunit gamma-like n=1 Tax=Oncorhynchus nerka TaxID=8023 RepID=UPI0031B89BB6
MLPSVSEEPKVYLGSGEQTLPMGILGAPQRESVWQWRAKSSPLWHLSQVKMVPQDSKEGQVSGQSALGASCSRRGSPMSTMSEADSMVPSPKGVVSDGSNSPYALMGTSAVFNQRPRKRVKM